MLLLRNSARLNAILLLAFSLPFSIGSAFAQSAAQLESDDVKRVASRLACQCGSCKSTVACEMPGGCGFCKRVKTKIAQMQAGGASDKQVIAAVVKESGPDMFLAEPGTWGWLTPYLAGALGLVVIYWFVRRSMRAPAMAAAGPPIDHEALDRYHERIEKDLEKLE